MVIKILFYLISLLFRLFYVILQKGKSMDVAFLINHYFKGGEGVSIDVFDAQSLNNVYQKFRNP